MPRTPVRSFFLAVFLSITPANALAQMPPNPPVDVAVPLKANVIDYDEYTGRFVAKQEVELRARVSGYLDEQRFDDGAVVEEGAVLFVIDQRPFVAAVQRAEAALASAEATVTLAQIELDRAVQLEERNVGTEQEVDRTQATLLQTQADVQIAEAELIQAELDLEYTTIRAPFTGRISASEVDVGNLVVGGTNGTTLLATIVSVSPIDFVFTASEADFLRYSRMIPIEERPSGTAPGLPVQIKLLDEDDFTHVGSIDFVDNRLSPNSGTIEVRARIPDPDIDVLVPGVFGRMRITGRGEYEALLVPEEAILSDQAAKIVMTVDEAGIVAPRPVTLGPLFKGMRAISSGIEEDTRVIVAGVQRARPGAGVTPNEVTLELED
ncbi:MAG: efflux RND transporter periplasmic adaptor subunit [Pseudomonadota bacterium]